MISIALTYPDGLPGVEHFKKSLDVEALPPIGTEVGSIDGAFVVARLSLDIRGDGSSFYTAHLEPDE